MNLGIPVHVSGTVIFKIGRIGDASTTSLDPSTARK